MGPTSNRECAGAGFGAGSDSGVSAGRDSAGGGLVARHVRSIPRSGIRDFFEIVQSMRDVISLGIGVFASAFGAPTNLHPAILESTNGSSAVHSMSGFEMGIGDVAHSRYILNFGGNPYETHFLYVPFIQRLIDARINLGAKLVTFDVRISQTAGKSDEWFPLVPGTDAMVVLSMAHIIAHEDLWDKEFIERWTNASPSRLPMAARICRSLARYSE